MDKRNYFESVEIILSLNEQINIIIDSGHITCMILFERLSNFSYNDKLYCDNYVKNVRIGARGTTSARASRTHQSHCVGPIKTT